MKQIAKVIVVLGCAAVLSACVEDAYYEQQAPRHHARHNNIQRVPGSTVTASSGYEIEPSYPSAPHAPNSAPPSTTSGGIHASNQDSGPVSAPGSIQVN